MRFFQSPSFILGLILLLIAWGGQVGLSLTTWLFDCSFGTTNGANCPKAAYEPIVGFFGAWTLYSMFTLGFLWLSGAAIICWVSGLVKLILGDGHAAKRDDYLTEEHTQHPGQGQNCSSQNHPE